ncbi:hypothetical protein FAF44_32420 [Nonomuraea sp. MG754425]|uniref:hypothetical protein n=1 Tax=Nonomuraea sp. MG754425 TaxID=2570319 RepID=UPI001F31F09C|nr:hypothetical protein [Nonomuraea sp. MG754425]MCF6473064.1 hypothetical protein [Nonomuraea sp. MG754425]
MKAQLIAAGGVLAAAALVATAPPAAARDGCDLTVADATHSVSIDAWGVYAGPRAADACQGGHWGQGYHTNWGTPGTWSAPTWGGGDWGVTGSRGWSDYVRPGIRF